MAESETYIENIHFSSHEEFIRQLLFGELRQTLEDYIFRGIGLEDYGLIPSVLRKNSQEGLQIKIFGKRAVDTYYCKKPELESYQQNLEFSMLYEFYRLCDLHGLAVPNCPMLNKTSRSLSSLELNHSEFIDSWIPKELCELAVLAQHYGIPTRLLDWTRDIFTAIFFATIGGLNEGVFGANKNVVIWALNLSYIDYIHLQKRNFPLKSFIPAYNSNPNLQAQSGVLTLWETKKAFNSNAQIDRRPLDLQLIEELKSSGTEPFQFPFFYKITLPHSELKSLLKVLDTLNYSESKNFPGYDGVAKRVMNNLYRMP
jgi:hypothetical protein